ncbi:MAG: hypothetical protein JSS49_28165 [Planctomycetes bacterium]|nr:hypothetical protein [Planctomycetota bacterium]
MTDISKLAIEVSDALFDYCVEIAGQAKQQDDCDRSGLHPLHRLMLEFLKALGESTTRLAILQKWDEFQATMSQHESRRLKVSIGIDFARWLKEEFDTSDLVDVVHKARRSRIWSLPRSPKDWLIILEALGRPMSVSHFARLRKPGGEFGVKPGSTRRLVSIQLDDLPDGYEDISVAEIVRKSSVTATSRKASERDG